MAVLPPKIHTYHCICTSLLIASTHKISTLPRRAPPSLDGAYILPVPSQPPPFSSSWSPEPDAGEDADEDGEPMDIAKVEEKDKPMPAAGYSLLVGMQRDTKITIIRREDGFEKRLLWRCGRCDLVIGYEITGTDTSGSGSPGAEDLGIEAFEGKVVYLLPNGILGTRTMVESKKIGEDDLEIGLEGRRVGFWE